MLIPKPGDQFSWTETHNGEKFDSYRMEFVELMKSGHLVLKDLDLDRVHHIHISHWRAHRYYQRKGNVDAEVTITPIPKTT